jgi:hypothetical protein
MGMIWGRFIVILPKIPIPLDGVDFVYPVEDIITDSHNRG